MSNLSDFRNGYNQNLDTALDIEIRLFLLSVSVVIMFLNGISLVAMNRTRHTPRTARFLSMSLLVFDFMAALMYTVRRMIVNTPLNLLFQLIAMGFNFLGFLNIAIMSLERLVVFRWPNFYLRKVSYSAIWRISVFVWVGYSFTWVFGCSWCFIHVDDADPKTIYCFTRVIHNNLRVIYSSTTAISCACLMNICFIIAHQASKTTGTRIALNSNKSTIVVMMCIANYLVATICNTAFTYLIEEAYIRRLVNDLMMIANGFVDTCVYVLWFKECRLEVIKMLGRVFPSIDKKVHAMRIEIFDISTYEKRTSSDLEQ